MQREIYLQKKADALINRTNPSISTTPDTLVAPVDKFLQCLTLLLDLMSKVKTTSSGSPINQYHITNIWVCRCIGL